MSFPLVEWQVMVDEGKRQCRSLPPVCLCSGSLVSSSKKGSVSCEGPIFPIHPASAILSCIVRLGKATHQSWLYDKERGTREGSHAKRSLRTSVKLSGSCRAWRWMQLSQSFFSFHFCFFFFFPPDSKGNQHASLSIASCAPLRRVHPRPRRPADVQPPTHGCST